MAIQAIETTTGKGAGEVRISHVLVRAPADARRCDESSKAIAAEGQGKELAELDAGVTTTFSPTASEQQQALPPPRSSNSNSEKAPLTPQKPARAPFNLPPTPSPTPEKEKSNQKRYLSPLKRPLDCPSDTEPQQSPLKEIQRADKSSTLSPSPTPSKNHNSLKRALDSPPDTEQQFSPLKKNRSSTQPQSPRTRTPFHRPVPKFSLAHAANNAHHAHHINDTKAKNNISWLELKRCAESVLDQVDWRLVARDVAGNRTAGTYRRFVRGLLQGRIEEMVAEEKEEEEEEEGGRVVL